MKDSQLQITMIIVITVGDFTEPWNSPNIALGHYLAEFIKTLDPDSPRLMGRTTDAHQDKHCLCWTQIRSIGHSRVMQRVKWGRGWGVGGGVVLWESQINPNIPKRHWRVILCFMFCESDRPSTYFAVVFLNMFAHKNKKSYHNPWLTAYICIF